MAEQATYQGTGKRKTSVARVILRPGDGSWWINGRSLESYFPRLIHRAQVQAPLTGLVLICYLGKLLYDTLFYDHYRP